MIGERWERDRAGVIRVLSQIAWAAASARSEADAGRGTYPSDTKVCVRLTDLTTVVVTSGVRRV